MELILFAAEAQTGPATPNPDRRAADANSGAPPAQHWLARVLDEIDYGVLLVNERGGVHYSNHAARRTLGGSPTSLRCSDGADAERLRAALRAAVHNGLRKMLTLGVDGRRLPIAVVPLPQRPGDEPAALLLLGRSTVCEALSAHGFAACHGLTPAESAVLASLTLGVEPAAIAEAHRVAISTVRTQIASIRQKTGAGSIRDLVDLVARLPPLVSSLRH